MTFERNTVFTCDRCGFRSVVKTLEGDPYGDLVYMRIEPPREYALAQLPPPVELCESCAKAYYDDFWTSYVRSFGVWMSQGSAIVR